MNFLTVLGCEFRKLRRTKVLPVLGGLYMIAPPMLCLMMAALRDPELGSRLGLLTTKAELTIGAVDWATYLGFVGFFFVGGIIVTGIAQAYVFGREYAEGTAKNMLTLPVPRVYFIIAKLIVTAVWFCGLALVLLGESLALGALIRLEGFSRELFFSSLGRLGLLLIQVLCLSAVPAWLAVITRGFIAPLGLSVLLLLLGDFFAHTLWGVWFPWSIVMLSAGAGGPGSAMPGAASLVVLLFTLAAGTAAAWFSLDRIDNTQ